VHGVRNHQGKVTDLKPGERTEGGSWEEEEQETTWKKKKEWGHCAQIKIDSFCFIPVAGGQKWPLQDP